MTTQTELTTAELDEIHDSFSPDGLTDQEVRHFWAKAQANVIAKRKVHTYCTIYDCTNEANAAHFSTDLKLPYCSKSCRELAETVERS